MVHTFGNQHIYTCVKSLMKTSFNSPGHSKQIAHSGLGKTAAQAVSAGALPRRGASSPAVAGLEPG